MPFRITQVVQADFPHQDRTLSSFTQLSLDRSFLADRLRGFASPTPVRPDHGHQQVLARELESFLYAGLKSSGLDPASPKVSPKLNEQVDVAFARPDSPQRLLIEIEFRPNFEKDLVKFMIAHRLGTLCLGVLIVAVNRTQINPRYTSMPEFEKVTRIVSELDPAFPLIVAGFEGVIS